MYLALPSNIHIDTTVPPTDIERLWLCTIPTNTIYLDGAFIADSSISAESFSDPVSKQTFTIFEFSTTPVVQMYSPSNSSWEVVNLIIDDSANTYNITTNLYGCTSYSTNPTQIDEGEDYLVLQFTPNDGYSFPTEIYVSGAEYDWYWTGGGLILRNPTGAVYVSISCVATGGTYDITVVDEHGYIVTIYSTNPTEIVDGETVTLSYKCSTVGGAYATADGADCVSEWVEDDSGFIGYGTLTVTLSNPTSDVTVTINDGKSAPSIVVPVE